MVQELNNEIIEWLKEKDKLVVAIDGYTGVGKTTLLNNLANLSRDILPIHRDDFMRPRITVEHLIKQAADRSQVFELQTCYIKKIAKLINAFRKGERIFKTKVYDPVSGRVDIPKDFDLSKKALVIEGVFMFHPKLLNYLWDKRVYIQGDIKDADRRRVQREKSKWGRDYFPETHPDSYFSQVIIALKRYNEFYKPKASADFVLEA